MGRLRKLIKALCWGIIKFIPGFKILYHTRGTQNPVTLKFIFWQKILGFNRQAYWPMHFSSTVIYPKNVYAGIDVCPGYSPGCYIQALGKIYIGDYTQIAPNVGVISANHDLHDNRKHVKKAVRIGKYCWLGMNSVILPDVNLGDFTIVAAGSVVTKSFPDGYQVIGGNPARSLKFLTKENCTTYENRYKYYGYVNALKFERFRNKNLNV